MKEGNVISEIRSDISQAEDYANAQGNYGPSMEQIGTIIKHYWGDNAPGDVWEMLGFPGRED